MLDLEKFTKGECEKIASLITNEEIQNTSGFIEDYRKNIDLYPNAKWRKRLRIEFNVDGSKVKKKGDYNVSIYENGDVEFLGWNDINLEMTNMVEVYKLLIPKLED